MWKTSAILVFIVLCLMVFGIVMLASTSGIKAQVLYGDPHYFVKRQIFRGLIALITGLAASRLDYHRWRFLAVPVFGVAVVLLALVFIPGIGAKIGGSRRWLHFGSFGFQPSEFAKFALILIMAWWMAREQRHAPDFLRGALLPGGLLAMAAGLIFLEPDFGTTILSAAVGMIIMYAGGARLGYLLLFAAAGLTVFSLAVMRDEVRLHRILAFMDPDKYSQTYSFQLVSAINAFIAGGMGGVGLGQSMQKHYYLPEAHTDFIFAIIGEELGVFATATVVIFFAGLFFCGLKISIRAPDVFGRLLAFGITMMITLQAAINIGVVTGCLPTKGLPLPFISFGGSSLIMSLIEIGVLLNIAQHEQNKIKRADVRVIKDRVHRF
ncbi:MAG: putative lipid II flippase FtsW [Kiritimatiellae bacterium]|nr:putative lipid II flippase FtsW [Kiritimatiellia bacterium]